MPERTPKALRAAIAEHAPEVPPDFDRHWSGSLPRLPTRTTSAPCRPSWLSGGASTPWPAIPSWKRMCTIL